MADWTEAMNAYEVLGLEQGPKATDAEIGKAYRSLALKYHPDKNKGDPEGAKKKFQVVKEARELLTDVKARRALDELLAARAQREQRFANQDAKRRKMREKLERDEQAVATERSEEDIARSRLQNELARLKKQAAERRTAEAEQQQRAAQAFAPAQATAAAPPAADAPPIVTESLLRSLKVSWSLKGGSYGSQQLQDAFAAYGPVEDVVLRASKRKSKGSAMVVMRTRAGAAAAASALSGSESNPLLVVPFLKVPAVPEEAERPAQPSGRQPAAAPPAPAGEAATREADAAAAAPSGNGYAPPKAALPLFPLDGAATETADNSAHGWPAGRPPAAPLFPVDVVAAPLAARTAGSAAAAPLPSASSFRPPASTSSSWPPPAAGGTAAFADPQTSTAALHPNGSNCVAAAQPLGSTGAGVSPPQQPQPSDVATIQGRHLKSTDRKLETPAETELRQREARQRLIKQMEAEDREEDARAASS